MIDLLIWLYEAGCECDETQRLRLGRQCAQKRSKLVIAGILNRMIDVHENQQHQQWKLRHQRDRLKGYEAHIDTADKDVRER